MLKAKFLTAALCLSVFLAHPLSSAEPTGSWQFAGWYGGGAYPAIVPDSKVSGRCYLTSDVAGVWRSDDRGSKWSFRTKGVENLNTAVLTIAPSNNNVLYTGTKGGVHKSSDAGTTWKLLPGTKGKITFKRPDNYRSIAVDRLDSNKVYAGTQTGEVYYSTDGGSTWLRAGSSTYPFGTATAISALYLTQDGATLFAASPKGLRSYSVSSKLWSTVSALSGVNVSDMIGKAVGSVETVYVTAGNKIAYSSNRGASWSYTAAVSSGTIYRIDVKPETAGTKILAGTIAGWNGGLFLSDNKGGSWRNVETSLTYDVIGNPTRLWTKGFQKPNSVAFDPYNSSILYYTDWWGVWRSDNAGSSWSERIKGAPNTVGSDVTVAANGTIYVATMDNGLMKSTDGGVSYTPLCPAAAYSSASYTGHFWKVLCLGSGNRLVATSSPWDVNVNQVAVSENYGATFTLVKTGLPSVRPVVNTVWDKGYIRALTADPTNHNKLYLGIDGDDGGGLYVSSNGGYNWARSSGQPGSKRIYNGLVVDPTNPQRLYWATVGTGGGVYRSENAGASWTKVFSASTYVFDLGISKEGYVYAGADNAGPVMYVSYDKGKTWGQLYRFSGTGACEGITIDHNNSKRMAVSATKWDDYAGGKIYLSYDGGKTWKDITSDLPNGSGAADMEFSRDGLYLYVTRYAGSVYRVLVDGAASGGGDTQPPSAPYGLLAGGILSKVTVWWGASNDNVGVAGYKVYRDGVYKATVTTTKYYDYNVPIGLHRYHVVAFDAAGNISASSTIASLTL